MSLSRPIKEKDHLAKEFRLALVGKTGVGKSATGNTILGHKKFESLPSAKSVTLICEHVSHNRFGRYLQVVDAPGFCDSSNDEQYLLITQCIALLSPGIHAILFVIRIGRYTKEDVETLEAFIEIFGSKSKDFVIVVFTGEDDLDEDYNLQNFIQNCDESLKTFLREVNNRFIAVNNKATAEEKTRFVECLLEKIEQLLRENKCCYYTCDILDKAEEEMQKLEDDRAADLKKRNKERDEKTITEAIEEYKTQLVLERISEEEIAKRIKERQNDKTIQIDREHHLEARNQARQAISKEIMKEKATLLLSIGSAATVGGAIGGFFGPIGLVIGGFAGATLGAVTNLLGEVVQRHKLVLK